MSSVASFLGHGVLYVELSVLIVRETSPSILLLMRGMLYELRNIVCEDSNQNGITSYRGEND